MTAARTSLVLILISALGFAAADVNLRGADWAPASTWEARPEESALLEEIEAALGSDHRLAAEARVANIEEAVRETFQAMPRNEYGNLGHGAVRYVLHRYFVDEHGWYVHGLDPHGGAWNASSPSEVLRDRVPAYVQGFFERRLGGRGFGVHEMAVLAATLENLIHAEAMERLAGAYEAHRLNQEVPLEVEVANDVMDTYMACYILNVNPATLTPGKLIKQREMIAEAYPTWEDLQSFARKVRKSVLPAHSRLAFSDMVAVVTAFEDQYEGYQRKECGALKTALLRLEEQETGCVPLSDFYSDPAKGGDWQFSESAAYLRQLGALDESDPKMPRVLVPNYISGSSNCISSSSFHQVCCRNECEDLMGILEHEVGAPDATPAELATMVGRLPSSTVAAGRTLSAPMLDHLEEIARVHKGRVPLHSRLFGQWMHHAYPRECPYPHLSKTTNLTTPEGYLETPLATEAEKTKWRALGATAALTPQSEHGSCAPWRMEEELHFAPAAPRALHVSTDMLARGVLEVDPMLVAGCVALLTALMAALVVVVQRSISAKQPAMPGGFLSGPAAQAPSGDAVQGAQEALVRAE